MMKKIQIMLLIITAFLASTGFAVAPDDVTNYSFEDDVLGGAENPCGGGTEPDTADFWITWGESARDGLVYHTDDSSNANTGSAYFEVGRGSDGWAGIHTQWGEEVAVIPGQEATLSVYARSADGTDQAGAFGIKFEFYATAGECWADGANVVEIVDVTGTYIQYSLTTTVPNGMFFARATITSEAAPVFVDDINICIGGEACDVVTTAATLVSPSPSGTFVDPTPGSVSLVWTNPLPLDPNDIENGNLVTSDVWFAEDDDPLTKLIPGPGTAEFITSPAITPGHTYSWRVDCSDPNRPDLGGSPVTTIGDVWTFNTINTAPTAEAGYNENAWLNDGSATVNLEFLNYDDVDNYPEPLDRTIAVDPTANASFDIDPTTGEDPNAITFTAPGEYTITLTVTDGSLETEDSFVVTVYPADTAEDYLVAHYPFDTNADDIASHSGFHHGVLVGDAEISAVDAQVGTGALSLDGKDDWVSIPDSNSVDTNDITWADFIMPIGTDPNDQVTIAAWIKPSAWSTDYTQVVSKGYPDGYRIVRPQYDSVMFQTDMPWGEGGQVYGGGEYDMGDGKWHHVVATWDGGAQALYIDGNYQYRQPQPKPTTLKKNVFEIQIGANAAVDGAQYFNGLIDDVRIYDIGLSHAEVLKLYASQGGSGTCGLTYAVADFTQDCVVNLADFAVFASEWLDCRDPITCP